MSTPCIACAYFKLKEYPQHAAVGMGRCGKSKTALFLGVGWDKPCRKFGALDEAKVEQRRVWWALRNKDSIAK